MPKASLCSYFESGSKMECVNNNCCLEWVLKEFRHSTLIPRLLAVGRVAYAVVRLNVAVSTGFLKMRFLQMIKTSILSGCILWDIVRQTSNFKLVPRYNNYASLSYRTMSCNYDTIIPKLQMIQDTAHARRWRQRRHIFLPWRCRRACAISYVNITASSICSHGSTPRAVAGGWNEVFASFWRLRICCPQPKSEGGKWKSHCKATERHLPYGITQPATLHR